MTKRLSFAKKLVIHLTVLMTLLPPSKAIADLQEKNILTLTGRGTVLAKPDIAYISTGVLSEAKTPIEGLEDNNAKMQSIFKLLEKAGIEKKHLQTSNFNIQPIYSHYRAKPGKAQRPPQISGYRIQNNLTVKIIDLQTIGKILTALVQSGSNQLGNIRFDVSNKQELLMEARKKAVQNTLEKAKLYAQEAGFKLGNVLSLRETNPNARPQFKSVARSAALQEDAGITPIAGGQGDLSLSVTIQWQIIQ